MQFQKWLEGTKEWWDEEEDDFKALAQTKDEVFEAALIRWHEGSQIDTENIRTIAWRLAAALPHLSIQKSRKILELLEQMGQEHASPAECLEAVGAQLQKLDKGAFELASEFVGSHLSRLESSERAKQINNLLYLCRYHHSWKDPSHFSVVFDFAVRQLLTFDPLELGRSRAVAGDRLGLPRPRLLTDYGYVLEHGLLENYQRFWTAAFRTFKNSRATFKRDKKLHGHFLKAMANQRGAIERIMREAENLKKAGFYAPSLVWTCAALEVFVTKVVARALLEGYGLPPGIVPSIMDDFFARNNKGQMLGKILKDYFKIDVPRRYWKDYEGIVALRNEIMHGGKRLQARREAEKAVSAVRRFLAEIPEWISASLPPRATKARRTAKAEMAVVQI